MMRGMKKQGIRFAESQVGLSKGNVLLVWAIEAPLS